MTSKQAEANPVPASVSSSGRDEVDKVNFLNLHCASQGGQKVSKALLSDSALRDRLIAVSQLKVFWWISLIITLTGPDKL